jgi:hypothetical protein
MDSDIFKTDWWIPALQEIPSLLLYFSTPVVLFSIIESGNINNFGIFVDLIKTNLIK